jgi:hypothetical protein
MILGLPGPQHLGGHLRLPNPAVAQWGFRLAVGNLILVPNGLTVPYEQELLLV